MSTPLRDALMVALGGLALLAGGAAYDAAAGSGVQAQQVNVAAAVAAVVFVGTVLVDLIDAAMGGGEDSDG